MSTPYFETELGKLYCGDCLEIMPGLEPVDLVLTDPPYGIGYDASHDKYKNGIDRGPVEWDTTPFEPSHILNLDVPSIIWGGNCFASRLPDHPGWLCWVKTSRNGANIRQADMELAWTNFVTRPQCYRLLWIGAYRESESGERNVHPTQKPKALMFWCLSLHPGEKVLDPYLGSGTTAVACERLNRKWIGIEISEQYCEIAAKRIENETRQLRMF